MRRKDLFQDPELGRLMMDTKLYIFDLGDAMEETRQASPIGFQWDNIYVQGWTP
jgi:hypothetical protein